MILLETIYNQKLKNNIFYDRKKRIMNKKTLILGPRKSGKTHLIIDYLQNFNPDEFLYIDFEDERIETNDISFSKLEDFTIKKHIKLLVLENFNFSFKIPKVENIIITSDDSSKVLENFHRIFLYPLDFEEFIAFDKRHFNIEQLFSIYSNKGTLIPIVLFNEDNYLKEFQKISKEFFNSKNEFLIFKKLSVLQSSKVSLFQIYNQLKMKMKISKDFLYNVSQKLNNRELVLFLEKYEQKKASKKIYLFDFAIKNGLTYKKDFLKRFENMVFLELYKREKTIFYTEHINFFMPLKNGGVI